MINNRVEGLLIGTAVGDALGLPAEGLKPTRIKKLFPGEWRHRFLFGRGMLSDDTQHTIFVARALLSKSLSVTSFRSSLAWQLRLWLTGIPAGIGLATLRSVLKLWIGFSPANSGVFSAGNGPAMRSAIIGAYFSRSPMAIHQFVEESTRITHTDPKAFSGALAIASITGWVFRNNFGCSLNADEIFSLLQKCGNEDDSEWKEIIINLRSSFESRQTVEEFCTKMKLSKGVSGYIYHTVPIAIYAWMRHYGDFRTTLVSVLDCGGDTDTVGAITGAIAGATVGEKGIPSDWVNKICDWPLGIAYLRTLAKQLVQDPNKRPAKQSFPFFWFGLFPRNLLFLLVVLLHGFRRLAPPY